MYTNPNTGEAYQDLFDALDGYQNILFNNGVKLQSRELNEMLSLLADRIKNLGRILFNDGSITKGGGMIIDGTSVKMLPISVLISGIVFSIDATDITITGSGTEIIGIKLIEIPVTAVEEPKLLDPAAGPNYGLPGADRLRITPTWVVNDPAAFPIYTLINGQQKVEKFAPESDSISAWLARRTNDESGSYTVSGLTGYLTDIDTDTMQLVVEAGKCYVQGWEIQKPSPDKTIVVPKSKSTKTVTGETHTYSTGTATYLLSSQPVKQIDQLTAQVSHTMNMTKGSVGGLDQIPEQFWPVSSITSISGYTVTTDYVKNGNSVDWSPGGSEPSPGATYSITFVYTKTMVLDTDYQLYLHTDDQYYAKFLSGDLPVNSSTFSVSYDYYLSRKDLFYVDKDGTIGYVQGTPGVTAPEPAEPVGILVLGKITLPAGVSATGCTVTNYDPKRLTMLELRRVRERVDQAEYNLAVTDLDRSAASMDPATSKKALYTDGFLNTNKMDTGYSGFSCSIDPDAGTLMSKYTETTQDLSVNQTGTTATIKNKFAVKPYTEIVAVSQLNATQSLNINEYAVYNKIAIISVTPNQDIWLESSVIKNTVYRWWDQWITQGNVTTTTSATTTTVSTKIVLDTTSTTIRQKTLTVTGSNFLANAQELQCTFDGVAVNLTIGAKGTQGSNGKINADSNGEFIATFTIPANVPTGTREIVIWNEVS